MIRGIDTDSSAHIIRGSDGRAPRGGHTQTQWGRAIQTHEATPPVTRVRRDRLDARLPTAALRWKAVLVAAALLVTSALPHACDAQQTADSTFEPKITRPAYPLDSGPVVLLDEAHHNFHTASGRYQPFVRLLEADGFRVAPNRNPFTLKSLTGAQVLVIANAVGGEVPQAYAAAAFTPAECDSVAEWVRLGGALFLIADHAPFGTGAQPLAARFNVGMSLGFTEDSLHSEGSGSILVFDRANRLIVDHPITLGRDSTERVNRVVAYTGQSLAPSPGVRTLLKLGNDAFDHPSPTVEQATQAPDPGYAWMTAVQKLPVSSARGRAVGVALRYGLGRVVILGEAAMLTAQVLRREGGAPPFRMGMNVPGSDNQQFALNAVRWLSGVLPAE